MNKMLKSKKKLKSDPPCFLAYENFIQKKVEFVLRLKQKIVHHTERVTEQEYLLLLVVFLDIYDKRIIKSFRIGEAPYGFNMKERLVLVGGKRKKIPNDIFVIFEAYFIWTEKKIGDQIYHKSDSTFNKQISIITREIFDSKYTINKLKKMLDFKKQHEICNQLQNLSDVQ